MLKNCIYILFKHLLIKTYIIITALLLYIFLTCVGSQARLHLSPHSVVVTPTSGHVTGS